MNNEDFERQMEFILEQQTKFAESLAKHQERFDANLAEQQERFAKQQERFDKQQERFDANLAKQQEREAEAYVKQQEYYAEVNERMDRLDVKIAELVGFTGILRDALIGLTHHAERHDREIGDIRRALAEQAEKGKETDARLNALMLVVERHVSDHQ